MRHALTICLLACAASSAIAADADACSIFIPPTQALHPSGPVAQSSSIFIEKTAFEGAGTFTLTNEAGDLFEHTITAEGSIRDGRGYGGQRLRVAPTSPLPPGTYTLTEIDPQSNGFGGVPEDGSYATETTFTVTADLPPEGAPNAPSLRWAAVAYDGPEDPSPFPPESSCDYGEDTALVRYRIETSADTAGYIRVAGEDAAGNERYSFDTLTEMAPDHSFILADYEGDALTQCISVTLTDLYGNTSAATRSCKPDGCVARHKNDRDPIDWADATSCEDWSPGFAERNAPGCACAQAPGAPAGSPAALALLAIGLLGIRRRR